MPRPYGNSSTTKIGRHVETNITTGSNGIELYASPVAKLVRYLLYVGNSSPWATAKTILLTRDYNTDTIFEGFRADCVALLWRVFMCES